MSSGCSAKATSSRCTDTSLRATTGSVGPGCAAVAGAALAAVGVSAAELELLDDVGVVGRVLMVDPLSAGSSLPQALMAMMPKTVPTSHLRILLRPGSMVSSVPSVHCIAVSRSFLSTLVTSRAISK
jgi:hypothetical protein